MNHFWFITGCPHFSNRTLLNYFGFILEVNSTLFNLVSTDKALIVFCLKFFIGFALQGLVLNVQSIH
ncbi:hypothetical protein BGC33_02675 [Bathymodiolus thermophilus thioautotrophic gill symbiont]|uniref:Uncharacterized protein n=1 Tax=Bathymodiolus thermophilus thioautotrophic gill symbiont TaxID=2360 RepID=A0A1J5U6Y8_9GAMM|nr:hypothetical protein BGC33_02675 [Bathymodiolus thermophilus thioautotrophic gill symbiont]